MYDVISAEVKNVPAVGIISDGFLEDARSAASSRGMPGVRYVPATVPPESTLKDVIEKGTLAAVEAVIKAVVTPLTPAEHSPRPKEPEKIARIVFNGSLNEVNRFYYGRGWTDGLPIIPPTEEVVAEMLTGTDLPPDMLLGKLLPRMGKVTVEKIAVNAAMAGALPTYMPVLIAATSLLLNSEMGFQGFCTFGVSTGSWSPFWVVNGPIRNDINLNSGSGTLSPGNIANAAIGRAMGLIIKNLGGIRKGIEDMGVVGNPMKYTMVMAENEEASPWEPLHTEFGMGRGDNAVTIAYPQSFVQHYPPANDEDGIMRAVADYIMPAMTHTIVFPPVHAKTLASFGWTKQDIKEFIGEYARIPAARQRPALGQANPRLFKGKVNSREGDTLPVIRDLRTVRVVCAGGPGAFIAHIFGGGPTPGKAEIQKIELPAGWSKLAAKYKNVVPNYVRY
ncbi:MAG: hypothetical protein A2Z29_06925 [Chloroflexi bacterium RBG_16_56_11]|nr:MAG: hypothetical protein A2Z29_06925 [Chloroflexi bacterium RBG_16_56_11]